MSKELSALKDCRIEGCDLYLPTYQVDQSVFPKLKRIIEGIGGKWVTKSQSFAFNDNPIDLFTRACTGESINLDRSFKKKTNYFPTPLSVIEKMNEYFDVSADMRILEPSAGEGAICDYLMKEYGGKNYSFSVDVCEKHVPFMAGLANKGYRVVGTDFMEMVKPDRGYHLILANPPFSKNQDVIHFKRMYELLAPGGRVICVMSAKWRSDSDPMLKKFRDALGYCFHSVESVPKGSFRASGTEIETCILILDKPLEDDY